MTWDLVEPYFVLALLAAVFGTMVTERFRVDVVSMIGVSLLLVTGVLSTKEVLAVFSNEAPITVAAMFVLSAALERTGVVEKAGYTAFPLCLRLAAHGHLHAHCRCGHRVGVHEQHAGRGHPDPGRDRTGPHDRSQRLQAA